MNTAEDGISRAIKRVEEACYRALEAISSGTQAGATGLFGEKSILATPIQIHLPWDIVTDILSRLPVKSLMRFKCVSISFYNLISNDPLFKKKHQYRHQSSLKVLVPDKPDTPLESATNSCCISSVSPAGEEIIDLEFPIRIGLPIRIGVGHVYNSCDGLFCIGVNGGGVIIWNPSTRQVKRFPRGHRNDEGGYITYALAHDSRSNVYKLLGVFSSSLRFYSTEMEMWRCVEDCPSCYNISYIVDPTIVNGAFHWLCSHDDDDDDEYIFPPHVVSLDICDETYGMLAMPKAFCETRVTPILCVMKGKLCVMCKPKSQTCWEMWVMNEYGIADSMTRMFSFSRDELPTRDCCPLYTPENIDIILIFDYKSGTLFYKDARVLCNQFDGEIKTNRVPHAFFESLISPHTCLQENVSSTDIVVANKFSIRDNRSPNFLRKMFCKFSQFVVSQPPT